VDSPWRGAGPRPEVPDRSAAGRGCLFGRTSTSGAPAPDATAGASAALPGRRTSARGAGADSPPSGTAGHADGTSAERPGGAARRADGEGRRSRSPPPAGPHSTPAGVTGEGVGRGWTRARGRNGTDALWGGNPHSGTLQPPRPLASINVCVPSSPIVVRRSCSDDGNG